MAVKKAAKVEWNDPEGVDKLLDGAKHPMTREIEALRSILLSASPAITEGVKWNSPSFYADGWIATIHMKAEDSLQLILHLGAKVKDAGFRAPEIKDEARLLKWLGKDRAVVRITDLKSLWANQAALQAIVRQWITPKDLLLTMPDVGDDRDFKRSKDRGRSLTP